MQIKIKHLVIGGAVYVISAGGTLLYLLNKKPIEENIVLVPPTDKERETAFEVESRQYDRG